MLGQIMQFRDLLLALSVVVIWGLNFIFVQFALYDMSPLLLSALRFVLVSIPAVFFIPFPKAPWTWVAAYGLCMFAIQFTLIFCAYTVGMTPGMASLLMQTQVFFTLLLAAAVLGEFPNFFQIVALLLALAGIGLVAAHLHDAELSWLGLFMVLGSAASWAVGNLITRKLKNVAFFSLVVWGSLFALLPLALVCFWFEGSTSIANQMHSLHWSSFFSLLYIVFASSWYGYTIWNRLLSRYPVSTVVPFTLLVPVVGMLSSALILGETLFLWKIEAAVLVVGALVLNVFSTRWIGYFSEEDTSPSRASSW